MRYRGGLGWLVGLTVMLAAPGVAQAADRHEQQRQRRGIAARRDRERGERRHDRLHACA